MRFSWINEYPHHLNHSEAMPFVEHFKGSITLFQYSEKAFEYQEFHDTMTFESTYGLFCNLESRYSEEAEWNSYADYVYSEIVLSFLMLRGLL